MERSRKIAAIAALTGLLIALGAVLAGAPRAGAEAGGEALPTPGRPAQEAVLRLSELPEGYVLGGQFFCGLPSRPGEVEEVVEVGEERFPRSPYDIFLANNATSDCIFAYERLYRPVGAPAEPTVVASFSIVTPRVAAATEVLADPRLAEELAARTIDEKVPEEVLRPVGSPPAVGEGSRRFRTDLFSWAGPSQLVGTVVLWRQGRLVGGILAGGAKPAVNDTAADRYAAQQQKLLEAPRPYEEAEAEDIPTFLGNPNLGVPVYWLGKEFKPGNGGGIAYFRRADARGRLAHPEAGRRMSIRYNAELNLDSWTPAGWHKFSRTEAARRQWSGRCASSQTMRLPQGHAVIYTAYGGNYRACPHVDPDHVSAQVFLPGAVVAIGESLCRICESEPEPQFDSPPVIKAMVRGLRRWEPGDAK